MKYLEDRDGSIYLLEHIAGLQPAPIKGDRTDQQKITHVNTIVHTVGGAVLHTAIPFDQARKTILAAWDAPQKPQPDSSPQ